MEKRCVNDKMPNFGRIGRDRKKGSGAGGGEEEAASRRKATPARVRAGVRWGGASLWASVLHARPRSRPVVLTSADHDAETERRRRRGRRWHHVDRLGVDARRAVRRPLHRL